MLCSAGKSRHRRLRHVRTDPPSLPFLMSLWAPKRGVVMKVPFRVGRPRCAAVGGKGGCRNTKFALGRRADL